MRFLLFFLIIIFSSSANAFEFYNIEVNNAPSFYFIETNSYIEYTKRNWFDFYNKKGKPAKQPINDLSSEVPSPKLIKKRFLNNLRARLKQELPEKIYKGVMAGGIVGVQVFNYFSTEARGSLKLKDTKFTLRGGHNNPLTLEITRNFDGFLKSNKISGHIDQEGDFFLRFNFKF